MPYPKDPTVYPQEFAALFRRALRESFEVDFGDRGTAVNYCHRLHAYRRAVECTKQPGWASLRNIILSARGNRVVFQNNSSAMDAIRSAAGVEAPSEAQLDAYLAQLEQGGDGGLTQDPDQGERGIPSEASDQEEIAEPAKDWQDIFGLSKEESTEN